MITTSCPTQDIQVGDIVFNKYNFFSRGLFLKYRVTGFLKCNNIRLVNGRRVKWDKKSSEWVSFGEERTLHTCFRPNFEDLEAYK